MTHLPPVIHTCHYPCLLALQHGRFVIILGNLRLGICSCYSHLSSLLEACYLRLVTTSDFLPGAGNVCIPSIDTSSSPFVHTCLLTMSCLLYPLPHLPSVYLTYHHTCIMSRFPWVLCMSTLQYNGCGFRVYNAAFSLPARLSLRRRSISRVRWVDQTFTDENIRFFFFPCA